MLNNYFSLFDEFDTLFDVNSNLSDAIKYSVPAFPPCNVVITKDGAITFTFALAGYKKENLGIEFKKDALIVKTKDDYKPAELPEGKVLNRGIKMPTFSYKYAVPEAKYDVAKLKATFTDGILTITIPAKEETEPKTNTFTIE